MKMSLIKKAQSFLIPAVCGLVLIVSGCSKSKTRETMDLDELRTKAELSISDKKFETAIACLEEITTRFPENPNIAHYKTLLAELYFKEGHYGSAQALYEHLNQFYPAAKHAEYSKYKSIQAMFYQALRPECDQTETESTLALCKDYLNTNEYTRYKNEVAEIAATCTQRLLDKEAYIFNYYLNNKKFEAAQKRLAHMKEKFGSNADHITPQLTYLEARLAQRMKDKELMTAKITELQKAYPKSEYAKLAADLTKQPTFIF